MGSGGGLAESNEDMGYANVPDAAGIQSNWTKRSAAMTRAADKLTSLNTDGEGYFDTNAKARIAAHAANLRTGGEAWAAAANHARDQIVANACGNSRLATDTETLKTAKAAAKVHAQLASQFPDNPSIQQGATTAAAAEKAAREARTTNLGQWANETTVNTKGLPEQGSKITSAAESSVNGTGTVGAPESTSPSATPSKTSPAPTNSSPSKPSNTTPSKPEQPSKAKPSDEKNSVEGDGKQGQTPQQQQNPQQGGQPQGGGQPQQGGQPNTAKPSVTPISTPTPIGNGGGNGKGGSGGNIRPANTLPPRSTPSGPLGTGAGAKPTVPTTSLGTGANNSNGGGRGGGAGAGTGTGSSSTARQGGMMGGGMGGAGHGGGQGGGSTRQKVEIKDRGQRGDLQGRTAEESATGGVAVEPDGPPTALPDRSPYSMPQVPNTPPSTPPTLPAPPSRP